MLLSLLICDKSGSLLTIHIRHDLGVAAQQFGGAGIVALALVHGCKCYRLSIAWTRIFPNGDETQPKEAGLRHYDEVIDECRRYGIEPLITISHYEVPFGLTKKCNAWVSRDMVSSTSAAASTAPATSPA